MIREMKACSGDRVHPAASSHRCPVGSGSGAAEEPGQEPPVRLGSPFHAMGRVWGQCGMGGNGQPVSLGDPVPHHCPLVRCHHAPSPCWSEDAPH